MRSFLKPCFQATRLCARALVTLACWTLWLALGLLLALQIYIASVHELEVPPYVIRSLEERFAASGVRATFGRTRFDPSGRILIENVRATLPAFPEPIATARALSARLNPWALLVGQVEELELHATGVTLFVPAMLSSSGRAEELVRDLDATLEPAGRLLTITQLNCQLGPLPISAHGTVQLAAPRRAQAPPLPVAEFLSQNYAPLARKLAAAAAQLAVFEEPRLQLELSPSESRGATARIFFTARGLRLPSPAIQSGPLVVTTSLPLLGDAPVPVSLSVTADELTLPAGASALRVAATVRGTLRPGAFSFEPGDAELTVAELHAAGSTFQTTALHLAPGPLPRVRAELVTRFAGQPLYARVSADLDTQTAEAAFSGRVDDGLLGVIGNRIGQDVRQWIDFPEPVTIVAARATFAPGWKWEKLHARLVVPIINAYHVPLTDGRVVLELTPTRLYAPEAFARVGDNFARGTYDHDPATHRYRFLLEGRLRPLAISSWFGNWWPDFFKSLAFPFAIPTASVEVAGRWGRNTGGESRIVIAAESSEAEIFAAKFDHARARIFIRPQFLDVFEFSGTKDTGEAHGSFTRRIHPVTQAWEHLDFDVVSTLDPVGPAKIFGPDGAELISAFAFDRPPSLTIQGHLDSATAPGGARQAIDITAHTDGGFRFHGFPLEHISLGVSLRDDALTLNSVSAGFAGGTVRGRTKVWGRGPARRLGFDYALQDASLGRAIAALENYAAANRHAAPPPPNRFLQAKAAVSLDLAASAEGLYDDAFTYRGEGSATLSGAELGEVKLLGLLSDLFSFTALRFTAARANFRIDGPRLVFSDVSLTGANSAINARGTYALDRRELDFNAKIFPFQESELGFKSIFGAVLSPLSNAFEVKLTGSLDQPSWRFLIGPTSLLRNLSQGAASAPAAPAPPRLSPLKP